MIATKDNLEANGVMIKHHFSDEIYIKETFISKGVELIQHVHSYDHISIWFGPAIVVVDGVSKEYGDGLHITNIKKGKKHKVIALEDITWMCVHATDDKNPDTVDVSLMSKVVKE